MPIFHYEGFGGSGRREQGQVEAPDETRAYEVAQALGITVVRLWSGAQPSGDLPWYRRDLLAGADSLSFSDQAELAGQLAILYRARLPASDIVRIIAESADRTRLRDRFIRVERLMADGATLADAFARTGARAAPLFLAVLRLADASPHPAEALEALARFFRRQDALRRQIAGALVYPAILIAGAAGVLVLIALFLAPNLAPMFAAMDRPVPPSIAAFLALGGVLTTHGPLLALSAFAGLAALIVGWQNPAFAALRRRLWARLPYVGPIARMAELARIVRGVELLLRAGEPLPDAFRKAADSFAGPAHAPLFQRAAAAIEEGIPAASVLTPETGLPPLFARFFQVGERSNSLPEILPILSAHLDERVERALDRAMTLVTPLLTLIVGGGIAMLVYSVMDAILSVSDLTG